MDCIRDERGFFFGKLPNQVLYTTKLSSHAKVVYASLDEHYGKNGKCFPGQRRIAEKTGLSLSCVNRGIKELTAKFIRVDKIKTKKGVRNEYVLLKLD